MAKTIRVYRREAWQICVSLILSFMFTLNFIWLIITLGNKPIPPIWVIPIMLLLFAMAVSIFWLGNSLEKKPYDMAIENITSKEQKITYKRVKV